MSFFFYFEVNMPKTIYCLLLTTFVSNKLTTFVMVSSLVGEDEHSCSSWYVFFITINPSWQHKTVSIFLFIFLLNLQNISTFISIWFSYYHITFSNTYFCDVWFKNNLLPFLYKYFFSKFSFLNFAFSSLNFAVLYIRHSTLENLNFWLITYLFLLHLLTSLTF